MKLYQAPYERRDKRTLLAFYASWKEASTEAKKLDKELSNKIERALRDSDKYSFVSITFNVEEAEKLKAL